MNPASAALVTDARAAHSNIYEISTSKSVNEALGVTLTAF